MITFFFKTYGCQANVADSEEIAKFLKSLGCDDVSTEEEADLLIVNTCAVRDKAEQKLFSYLGRLSEIKKQKPYVNIGVIGCVASYKKDEIYKRFDQVNFVYGAREDMKTFLAYLTDMVVKLETKKQMRREDPTAVVKSGGQDRNVKQYVQSKGLFAKSMPLFKKQSADVKPFKTEKEMAASFINIMTGCNKFCKYCIVPFTRGREVSYDMTEIIDRVKHDVACDVKEITLIGQNVNSYRDPQTGADFAELLRHVAAIEGEFWIRWVSPHPQDMTIELFDVIAQHRDKIPPYVHFPVQSGSTRMLFEMGRNHTIELYLEQIDWLRSRLPDATISTDLIVGYPGETEEDFQQTMALLEKVRYDLVYSFIYSPRNYTPAAKLADSTPAEVKTQRLEALQERQRIISREKNDAHIGKIMKSLVEKRLPNGKLLARTEGNVRVLFDGDDALISSFVNVKINEAGVANMFGMLV